MFEIYSKQVESKSFTNVQLLWSEVWSWQLQKDSMHNFSFISLFRFFTPHIKTDPGMIAVSVASLKRVEILIHTFNTNYRTEHFKSANLFKIVLT